MENKTLLELGIELSKRMHKLEKRVVSPEYTKEYPILQKCVKLFFEEVQEMNTKQTVSNSYGGLTAQDFADKLKGIKRDALTHE